MPKIPIKVYTENEQFKTIGVTEDTTVVEAANMVVGKMTIANFSDDWQLYVLFESLENGKGLMTSNKMKTLSLLLRIPIADFSCINPQTF